MTINFSAQPKLSTLLREFPLPVANAANATLTMLYRQVGHRIRTEVLRDQHATYGERIVASLMRQLSWTYFLALLPLKELPIPHGAAPERNDAGKTAGGSRAFARQDRNPTGRWRAYGVTIVG